MSSVFVRGAAMRGNAKGRLSALAPRIIALVFAFAFAAAPKRIGAPAAAAAAQQASKIAFAGDREGQSAPDEIYVMNADGTGERRLTPTSDSCGNSIVPRWSPTGHQIVFFCFIPAHSSAVFVINPDGTGLRQVTPPGLPAAWASWSPDGKHIVFRNEVTSQLNIINVDGSGLTQLTTRGDTPDWAPDGKHIAFGRSDPSGTQIYIVDVDAPSDTNRLTMLGANAVPRWSPDGRKIAFESTRDGNREIYVMNADGGDQAASSTFSALASWAPAIER